MYCVKHFKIVNYIVTIATLYNKCSLVSFHIADNVLSAKQHHAGLCCYCCCYCSLKRSNE